MRARREEVAAQDPEAGAHRMLARQRNERRSIVANRLILLLAAVAVGGARADEPYLRYVHPTIRKPFPDLTR
jgi:hypothetical protein